LWTNAECVEEGDLHPDTYNVDIFNDLNRLTLRYEFWLFKLYVIRLMHLQ